MVTPAHVPPGPPLLLEVLEEFTNREGETLFNREEDVSEVVVLRLPAIREIDGPASTNGFAFDMVQRYWTSNGNCHRLAVICSKLRSAKDGDEVTIARSKLTR